ncbi:hypothetical protein GONAM_07_00610 [Gordonia namibiensis NBRC 108229]|uniref:Stress-response A/B barrel domain-containing protein n=1 Tax=Gordonia namibiensis NBRC 108229 TaxID=1208314 RepID=K6WIG3_9ACTN|nr:Dabb family protein [Gordonia namibiensis]GAB99140.1 hypothetical protein GONAM_07_00610 [Gordonia namibiensis NBRC 108229]
MYKVTALLHLADPGDDLETAVLVKRLRGVAEESRAQRILIEPTLPGVRNGGDLLVHLQFADAGDWEDTRAVLDAALGHSAVRHVDAVEYLGADGPGTTGRRDDGPSPTVYRTLLLRVDETAPAAEVDRFENATLAMPDHLSGIRAWQLSPVIRARGASTWTHVWEQEFADVDALTGQYMMHPVHWGLVDRWFDPECPDRIISDRVCHSYCRLRAPVI